MKPLHVGCRPTAKRAVLGHAGRHQRVRQLQQERAAPSKQRQPLRVHPLAYGHVAIVPSQGPLATPASSNSWHNAPMRDLPVACTLSVDELSTRRDSLLPGLIARATDRVALDDGHRLTFSPAPGLLDTIARVIDAERQCCRYLRFQLVVEQDGAPITLDVTGPEGTKEFLADLIASGGTEVPPYGRSPDAWISGESA